MARTTISVSDDLKKRMDRCKEPVNWSAIAAEAFELKLGEIARRQQEKTVEAVVSRLRASKISMASGLRKEGHEEGKRWAEHQAEYDELVNAAKIDVDEIPEEDDNSAWGAYGYVACTIIDAEPGRMTISEFWENAIGNDQDKRLDSREFLQGFCEGASEVFEKVNPEL